MSEQEISKQQTVQLTEDQLDDVQGGLLPAVKSAGGAKNPVPDATRLISTSADGAPATDDYSAVVFVGGWGSS